MKALEDLSYISIVKVLSTYVNNLEKILSLSAKQDSISPSGAGGQPTILLLEGAFSVPMSGTRVAKPVRGLPMGMGHMHTHMMQPLENVYRH